ncbi:MAG: 2OG-Fe(II) oxygenase [Gammaproteobacteria bacterium]|nr:2OG-Fe(II) oxygenase [Gammaproteobacteria bacterium]
MADTTPTPLCGIWTCEIADDAALFNAGAIAAYRRERQAPDIRQTHHFHGRFENTYIPVEKLPELAPIIEFVLAAARRVLAEDHLRYGFWFNETPPGHRTSLHSHEELDERLSAVYYLDAPPECGDLLLHEDDALVRVRPRAGLAVLFPPDLPHEVDENRSGATRLSVAFNFGPAEPAC